MNHTQAIFPGIKITQSITIRLSRYLCIYSASIKSYTLKSIYCQQLARGQPLLHLQVSLSAIIHITDDSLLNTSHTYDGSPVPVKPS